MSEQLNTLQPTTQARFADLVGITQPTVSELVSRGVLKMGDPAGAWLLDYCDNLRRVAARRDQAGPLTTERVRVVREQADRLARRNSTMRGQYLPVVLLEAVLENLAGQVASQLGAVMPDLRRRFPGVGGEPIRYLEERFSLACELAANARFDLDSLAVDLGENEYDGATP